MERVVKVGTRKSALALKQTELVLNSLRVQNPSLKFEVVELSTTGDFRRDKLNLQVQDKKQWIIELEKGIINRDIDFAVHSGKDVPLNLEPCTRIMSALEREDPRDVLIVGEYNYLDNRPNVLPELGPGSIIGTSSKRRTAQLLRLRPDLCVRQCRGNVPTRIEKTLVEKEFQGIVLGQAGVNRLSINTGYHRVFSPEELVPAVCQGTLVVQYREGDLEIESLLRSVQDSDTEISFRMEREVIERLGADCHSSLGVYSSIKGDNLYIMCRVCSPDGSECVELKKEGTTNSYMELASQLAKQIIDLGAMRLL